MGVVKGVFSVVGKALKGTAWFTSKVLEESTGIDFYGTVEAAFRDTNGKYEGSFAEKIDQNREGYLEKKEEWEDKKEKAKAKAQADYIKKMKNNQKQK